jgi:anti-sigma B factor antagonist
VVTIEITTRDHQGSTIVAMAGELDLSQVPAAEKSFRSVEGSKPSTLVVDLSGLTFIDSSGLRLVLEADQRARREGRRLVLIEGPEAVQRVFLIALLDKRLEFIRHVSELGVEDARD